MCLESCAKFDAMSCKHSYFHFADLIILSLIEVNFILKSHVMLVLELSLHIDSFCVFFFFFLKNENFLVPFYSL